jgi:hypothetical protein
MRIVVLRMREVRRKRIGKENDEKDVTGAQPELVKSTKKNSYGEEREHFEANLKTLAEKCFSIFRVVFLPMLWSS